MSKGTIVGLVILAAGFYGLANVETPLQYDYRAFLSSEMARASLNATEISPPDKPKVPRSKCGDCKGTGKVGDGDSMVDCNSCYPDNQTAPPDIIEPEVSGLDDILTKANEVVEEPGDSKKSAEPFDTTLYRKSTGEWGTFRSKGNNGQIYVRKVWVSAGKLLRLKKKSLDAFDNPLMRDRCGRPISEGNANVNRGPVRGFS